MEAAAEETHRASRRQVPQLPVPSVLGKVPTAPALRSQHHEARAELSLALGWDTAGPSQVAPARGGSAPAQPAAPSLPPSTPSPNTAEPKLGKMTWSWNHPPPAHQQHHRPPAARSPSPGRSLHAPVALVPDPGVAASLGAEVGPAVVVDLGGEAEQAAVPVGPVGQAGRAGEAVLLGGTV